jgi:hypothetical protein
MPRTEGNAAPGGRSSQAAIQPSAATTAFAEKTRKFITIFPVFISKTEVKGLQ